MGLSRQIQAHCKKGQSYLRVKECVPVPTCAYTRIHIHIYIYTHILRCIYVYIYSTYICMYIYTDIHLHVCISIYTFTHPCADADVFVCAQSGIQTGRCRCLGSWKLRKQAVAYILSTASTRGEQLPRRALEKPYIPSI